ncbi:Pentatricopeptide repeat-containing protein [Camellia lanceoleosa]|uniref:Pentatricopeptide repeat-containing protein n=1 Tax=Camellia lanceoleosa TaxID=1840588 RepID=A0ACC0I2V6_9ERIC|nr:Pentatricopeptide repeat-containing protein [Camellia lanceoleosa]
MPVKALELNDSKGYPALNTVARFGNTEAAEILVATHSDLLYIRNEDDWLPLRRAAQSAHKDTLSYLLMVTNPDCKNKKPIDNDLEHLAPFEDDSGVELLVMVIASGFYEGEMKFEPPSHSLVVCVYYCCNLQVWNNERNKTFEVADDSPNLIFSLMLKTLLSRIKPRHNPKPSSSPSFSFKPHIKRLVNELCDILKTHHHNQWQDTLETRLSEEEIVPSDIAHLVLDRIRDPELGLKFFDWVTQRPYGCSLDGFAYSSLLKLLASSRVF